MLKKILLIIFIATSNFISTPHSIYPLSAKELETIEADAANDHQLERVITLAELNDMLIKIEDDLLELDYLDRPDTYEIGLILEAKREAIIELLAKVSASIKNQNQRHSLTEKILIGSSIGLGLIVIGAGCLGAYDAENGWHRPTANQVIENVKKILA